MGRCARVSLGLGAILPVMARTRPSKSQTELSGPPVAVSVTVTVVPARRGWMSGTRAGLATRRPRFAVAGLAFGAAVTCVAAAALVLQGGRTNPHTTRAAMTQQDAATAVARAFGYPRRCLSVTVSDTDPNYASAHVNRAGGCANYGGYVNASFHRVGGAWRLVLDERQLFVPNALLSPRGGGSRQAVGVSGYALGCVSVGVALHDPRFGRADFDRRLPCVRDVR